MGEFRLAADVFERFEKQSDQNEPPQDRRPSCDGKYFKNPGEVTFRFGGGCIIEFTVPHFECVMFFSAAALFAALWGQTGDGKRNVTF